MLFLSTRSGKLFSPRLSFYFILLINSWKYEITIGKLENKNKNYIMAPLKLLFGYWLSKSFDKSCNIYLEIIKKEIAEN